MKRNMLYSLHKSYTAKFYSSNESSAVPDMGVPSGILIHLAIWPQRTLAENWGGAVPLSGGAGSPPTLQAGQTDKQDRQTDRQDNGQIA